MSQQTKLYETPEGWDKAASNYAKMVQETGFTGLYATDCLDKTIPVGSIPDGLKILDIAAGTGALSILAAERVRNHNGLVIATDFSPAMIEQVKIIVSSMNASSSLAPLPVEARVMDGQALEFEEGHFDFVYSVFGAIFFPDFKKGFSEMYRVLKLGGKIAVTSWSANKTPLAETMIETLQRLYKDSGLTPPKFEPPTFLYLSDPTRFENTLKEAGFKNVTVTPSIHTLKAPIDRFISFNKGNPANDHLVNSLHDSIKIKYDETFRQILSEKFPSGEIAIESLAYIAVAEK